MPTVLLSLDETARRLNEHPQTTRRRLRKGELDGMKKSDAARAPWFVTEKSLESYIARRALPRARG